MVSGAPFSKKWSTMYHCCQIAVTVTTIDNSLLKYFILLLNLKRNLLQHQWISASTHLLQTKLGGTYIMKQSIKASPKPLLLLCSNSLSFWYQIHDGIHPISPVANSSFNHLYRWRLQCTSLYKVHHTSCNLKAKMW